MNLKKMNVRTKVALVPIEVLNVLKSKQTGGAFKNVLIFVIFFFR